MNHLRGMDALRQICRRGTLQRTLEHYIQICRVPAEEVGSDGTKKTKRTSVRFPNLAGFCRYRKISMEELAALAEEFPSEMATLYAVLEDEALNSGLPPPILSAYLKKRLGYEREFDSAGGEEVRIRFEHDIYADGA